MRNLIIRREKSFVACLVKDQVYIEDPYAGTTTIGGVPCRKLGDLKNGAVQSFVIGEQAARVFVISDKLSKNYCNDLFVLPEGPMDVYLSGTHVYNLANGHAFRFANNDHPEALVNRKRGARVGWIVLAVAVVIGFLIGFLSNYLDTPQEKTFTAGGMSITLTDAFTPSEMEGYTAMWESYDVAVVVLEEPFSTLTEAMDAPASGTVEEYLRLLIEYNGEGGAIETVDGLPRYYYDWTNEYGEIYRFYTYAYKTEDAFWMVQIVVYSENVDDYEADVSRWAQSVTFDG